MRQSGGFTLLELLLAFVVFSLSFAIVMEILGGSMRNTMRARNYTEAALIAQSVMDQVGLEIPLEPEMQMKGESGGYDWNLDIVIYEDSGENSKSVELASMTGIEMLEIQLVINWGEPPRERSVEFGTVRARLAGGGQRMAPIGRRVSN